MLTTFFRKSKPINFLVVGVFMAVYYFLVNYIFVSIQLTWSYFLKKTGLLLVYLLLMFIVNFIVKRNEVTKQNTFTIVLFALFTVLFPTILKNQNILIASFFLLLALRRIMSLYSQLEVSKKIFDASFWISIATLFYSPTLLFLLVLFCGILVYAPQNFKHWLIPFTAVITVVIIKTTFNLLLNDSFFNPLILFEKPSIDFLRYNTFKLFFPLSLLIIFSVWTLGHYFYHLQRATLKLKTNSYLIVFIWMISIAVVLFSSKKDGSELMFLIIPACVIGANYFQKKSEKILKEIILVSLIIIASIMPFL